MSNICIDTNHKDWIFVTCGDLSGPRLHNLKTGEDIDIKEERFLKVCESYFQNKILNYLESALELIKAKQLEGMK